MALDADFRIFFDSATAAVAALTRVKQEFAPEASGSGIALTAGPVRCVSWHRCPERMCRERWSQGRSFAMRALHPPLVLASGEFVALAATEGFRLANSSRWTRDISEGSYAVFRRVREEALEKPQGTH